MIAAAMRDRVGRGYLPNKRARNLEGNRLTSVNNSLITLSGHERTRRPNRWDKPFFMN